MRIASRLERHALACAAGAAAVLGGASESAAQIVYSGVVDLPIASTSDGLYLNVVTGAWNTSGGGGSGVPGWDVNIWSGSSLQWFAPASATTGGFVRNFPGGLGATLVDNLPPGTLICPAASCSVTGLTLNFGTGGSETGATSATRFLLNSSSNLAGFRFLNEATNTVHYGWLRISLGGTFGGQPRTLIEYAYEATPGTPIAAGDTGPVGPFCGDEGTGSCCVAGDSPLCDNEACCTAVCEVDPFCCSDRWDEICAARAYAICNLCTVGCGSPGTGNCCENNPSKFCTDAECCTLICTTIDPFCCNVRWDSECARLANENCSVCTAPPPACGDAGTGSCCERNGTAFCDDASCCATVCAQDASCCEVAWDEDCAALAAQLCTSCWSCGDAVAGSCCVANGTPYCDNSACCTAVCAQDPSCCAVAWDADCAALAAFICTTCPPVNNNCADALPISLGDTLFSTLGATTDGPDTPAQCNTGTTSIFNDVWYLFTAGKSGTLTVSTCSQASFDTKLALYTSCSGEVLVACNDDGAGCANFTSLMVAPVVGGTTYVLRVGGWNATQSGTGTLTLSFEPLPPPACGDPGTGNCCEATGTPFCEDAACCNLVCGIDPFCCDTEWDSFCANIAAVNCAACAPPLSCGDPRAGNCCDGDSQLVIDVTGIESFAGPESPLNTVLQFELGGTRRVVGIGFDVVIQSLGESWLSEAAVRFGSSTNYFVALRPGAAVNSPGGNLPTPFSSQGIIDIESLNLAFNTEKDGILRLEFYETFVDSPTTPDAIWVSGTLTVVYADNITPFCDNLACCEAVCAVDAFCCETRWDSGCAAQAAILCETCAPPVACGDPGTGDCCESNGTPFCDNAECCSIVCAIDSFCCTVEWDEKCVAEAEKSCTICEPPPPPCPWDLNNDGQVNGADLGLLLQNWGSPFGGADLGALLQSWGACPQ